jgi:hypothetical protein
MTPFIPAAPTSTDSAMRRITKDPTGDVNFNGSLPVVLNRQFQADRVAHLSNGRITEVTANREKKSANELKW